MPPRIDMTDTTTKPKAHPSWLKLTLEMGPLLLFFFANSRPALFTPFIGPLLPQAVLDAPNPGLYVATAVLMIAVIAALIISFVQLRRVPIMPLVTAVLVVVFGTLTFYFQDERFIKMKPTVLYLCFAAALLGGLALGKSLLPIIFENSMTLPDKAWRTLTVRWGLFFVALAILNEIIWRSQSNDFWVAFKFPGTMIIIFVFTMTQIPFMLRNEIKTESV
jgi:intracellular septation protein